MADRVPLIVDTKIYVITAEKLLGDDRPYIADNSSNKNKVYFDAWIFKNLNVNSQSFNNHVLLAYIYIDFKFTDSIKSIYIKNRSHSDLKLLKKYWYGHIIYNPNNDKERCIFNTISTNDMTLDADNDGRDVINISNLLWKNVTLSINKYYNTGDITAVINELKLAYGNECIDETVPSDLKFIVPVCMKFTIL